jgi:hypothetical protein
LYLKNTATKAKEFQLSTAGLLFQTFINSLFCRTVLLSIECFGIRHELPQKRTITNSSILNNNTRGLTTDRAAIAKAVAGFFLFHSFSQSKLIQAPRETEKITAEESTIQRRVLEKQNLEKGWI